MESADDASISFRIGPSSSLGNAWAFQILFCSFTRYYLLLLKQKIVKNSLSCLSWMKWIFASTKQSFSLANIGFLFGAFALFSIVYVRRRSSLFRSGLKYKKKFWKNLMDSALNYEEWLHAATLLESCEGQKEDTDLYDEDLIASKIVELKHRRMDGDIEEIAFHLRTDLVRNLGSICSPELHKGRLQTPALIKDYIQEVRLQLQAIVESKELEFPLEEKLAYVHETRHAFGRTALLLSGGAALGAFHLGVVRTLIEHKLLPRVITGASVGSIICSFCATRTWTELQSFFEDPLPSMSFFEQVGSIVTTVVRLFRMGAVQDVALLQRKLRTLIGDLTFQEAYEVSGRVLGVTVSSTRKHEQPRLLNYLTSPHVMIWSAVTASCAFPGLYQAQELMVKDRLGKFIPYHVPGQEVGEPAGLISKRRWRDGSLDCDLPIKELKELFNVNHYIVSQANPHIAPLLRLKEACRSWWGARGAKFANLCEMEFKHHCNQAVELGWGLGGIPKLFSQPWEGDVTIVMPATVSQFSKIITNPSPADLRKAVMQGRRCTWAKVSAMQANCGIELTLDECVSELNHQRKKKLQEMQEARQRAGGRGGAEGTVATETSSEASGGLRMPSSAPSEPETAASEPCKCQVAEESDPSISYGMKRIPSWNCVAREIAWGSLYEDGILDTSLPPAILVPPVPADMSLDHDYETTMRDWVLAGGPTVRTSSPPNDGLDSIHESEESQGEDEAGGSTHSQRVSRLQGLGRFSLGQIWDKFSNLGQIDEEAEVGGNLPTPSHWAFPPSGSGGTSRAEDISYGLILRECLRRSPPSSSEALNALCMDVERQNAEKRGLLGGEESVRGGNVFFERGNAENDEPQILDEVRRLVPPQVKSQGKNCASGEETAAVSANQQQPFGSFVSREESPTGGSPRSEEEENNG